MILQMELKVSKKTENYFDKVSKKTNRKIDIEIVDRFDVEGMSAAFSPHPSSFANLKLTHLQHKC